MKIAGVHRQQVATVRPTTSLRNVARLIEETDTGVVVVVDADGRVGGVISERDLVRALAHDVDPRVALARSYATKRVLTAALDDETSDVARTMLAEGVRRLPVVSDGELVGVVSMRDLFALETFLPGTDISPRDVDDERELAAARTAS